jgi:crotonobetaine/carnitine-CoA ligase
VHRLDFTDIEERLLHRLLPEQAEANGDAVWLMLGDQRHTFAGASAAVEALAGGLAQAGVGPGDLVAVFMDNSIEFVYTVLALTRLGAVHVPVNIAFKGEYLRQLLEHVGARAVVVDSELGERLMGALPSGGLDLVVVKGDPTPVSVSGKVFGLDELRHAGAAAPAPVGTYSDTVAILYTSGTSGRSKGALQSHHYWYTATMAMAEGRDIRDGDVFHLCTPMFHAGAWLLNLYPSLIYGLPVGIDVRFSVTDYWDSVRRYGATQLFTLGAMHMWLWGLPETPEDATQPGRVWTAVPLPGALWEPFKARFGLDGVFSAYGQTEIMPATTADIRKPCKPGSAGWAQPNLELRVFDDHDREVPAGEVGELVVRPRTPEAMFGGYHRMPAETLAAFRNLWYHTGDLVRIDADGELFFVDRKADYLRRRGENISSLEVEEVVRRHPAVADLAVHGVPAGDLEDEVKLCVVLKEGAEATPLDVATFCSEHLPYFAVPRYIEFVTDLPRTPTGRVQKFLLRERGVTAETWDRVAAGFEVKR